MAQKSETTFAEGDFVVYPTHGVGRILGTEERDVGGAVMEMLDNLKKTFDKYAHGGL